jgi:hypothetical protein
MDYVVSVILSIFGYGGSAIKPGQTTSSAFFHS